MRYISASDMRFSTEVQKSSSAAAQQPLIRNKFYFHNLLSRYRSVALSHYARYSLLIILLFAYCLLLTAYSSAEIINRVVAYVDDTAITLSEFEETYNEMREAVKDITKEEAINSMINSVLLLHEARKMRLDAPTKEDLVKDYIDIKIRSLIFIRESDIRAFYEKNIDKFKGIDYLQVRDEVESYLFELETNRQLKSHLEQLRANAEIKIQLE